MSVIKYGNETLNPVVQVINGSNPNLLDNPWFTVNQRGKSEYADNGNTYSVDRWILQNQSGNVKFEVIPDSNNSRWITTEINDGLLQPVNPLTIGETYTISFNNGYKIFTSTFIWEGTDIIKLYDGAPTTNFAVIHDSTHDWVYSYVRYAGLASKSIKAVKLELGSVSTLYLDSAPDYATELMKCITSTVDPNDTYANKVPNFAPNPNLLDNPWFTVNQRGKGELSCSTNNTYFVDRWSCVDCDATNFKMTNNGINICSKNKYGAIGQPIENLIAGTYTFSVIVTECNVSEYYIFIHDSSNNQMAKVTCSGTGLKQVTFTITENKQLSYFKVYANKASTTEGFTIKAAKLELGSVSTLAMDTAPNYATELAKCQYYYRRLVYVSYEVIGTIANNNLSIYIPITSGNMRMIPAITISADILINGIDIPGEPINDFAVGYKSGTISLQKHGQTFTKQYSIAFADKDGCVIELSADL